MINYKVPELHKFQWQQSVLNKTLSTPPISPNKGDRYIVASDATDEWEEQENNIVYFDESKWKTIKAINGMVCYVENEKKHYTFNEDKWIIFNDNSECVPYINAIDDVNLGEHSLIVHSLGIDIEEPEIPLHIKNNQPDFDWDLTVACIIETESFNVFQKKCYSSTNFVSNIDRAFRSRGTKDSPETVEPYDPVMRWSAEAYNGDDYKEIALITFGVSNDTNPDVSGRILFYTSPTDNDIVERMSIDQNGNIKINKLEASKLIATDENKNLISVDSIFDTFQWQSSVLKRLNTPPESPNKGDRYLIIETAFGDWLNKENNIATYNGTSWDFTSPTNGMVCYVEYESKYYMFDGSIFKQTDNYLPLSGGNLNGDLTIGSTTEGKNLVVEKTVYTNIAPPLIGSSGNNWTLSDVSGYVQPFVGQIKKTGTGNGTVSTTNAIIEEGKTYIIEATVEGLSTGTINWTAGGKFGTYNNQKTFKDKITASSSGSFVLSPSASYVRFSISDLTITEYDEDTGNAEFKQSITVGKKIYVGNCIIDGKDENYFDQTTVSTPSSYLRILGGFVPGYMATVDTFETYGEFLSWNGITVVHGGIITHDSDIHISGGNLKIGSTTLTEQNLIDLLNLI